jgi:hypothetical protein
MSEFPPTESTAFARKTGLKQHHHEAYTVTANVFARKPVIM